MTAQGEITRTTSKRRQHRTLNENLRTETRPTSAFLFAEDLISSLTICDLVQTVIAEHDG